MKMKRDFLQDKIYIFMAEIIAILRESFWMWELQKEASQWYQMEMGSIIQILGCNIIIVLLNQVDISSFGNIPFLDEMPSFVL